ncbi:uncharacterized protein V1516DRAFT_674610 [Lipomyces oligophaga]|uniref:uncharacterized protein n=1 Tax=Lipomyces oligophaga TaxID=45792 RepID=UPI0034CF464D
MRSLLLLSVLVAVLALVQQVRGSKSETDSQGLFVSGSSDVNGYQDQMEHEESEHRMQDSLVDPQVGFVRHELDKGQIVPNCHGSAQWRSSPSPSSHTDSSPRLTALKDWFAGLLWTKEHHHHRNHAPVMDGLRAHLNIGEDSDKKIMENLSRQQLRQPRIRRAVNGTSSATSSDSSTITTTFASSDLTAVSTSVFLSTVQSNGKPISTITSTTVIYNYIAPSSSSSSQSLQTTAASNQAAGSNAGVAGAALAAGFGLWFFI